MTSRTNSDLAYEVIRAALIAGDLEPGRKLRLIELSQRFEFSAGVLREALPRLVAEGFVESRPQSGFRVRSLSTDDLVHLTEFRLLIELEAFRQSVTAGDDNWEADVVGAAYRLKKAPVTPSGPSAEWAQAHSRFHQVLVQACPNPYLRAESMALRDRGEMFRAWSQPASWNHRDLADEHQMICDAAVDHDTDLAVERLRAHITTTTEHLLAAVAAETTGSIDQAG